VVGFKSEQVAGFKSESVAGFVGTRTGGVMRVWRLIPVDLQAPAWKATIYKGVVMVRAESERRARELARKGFSDGRLPVTTSAGPPWTQPEVVRADPIEDDPRYPTIGGPEILEPS
jgi:hypothetical protein